MGANMRRAATGARQTRKRDVPPATADARISATAGMRTRLVILAVMVTFTSITFQLARLAASGTGDMVATLTEQTPRSLARPDIVDRGGRLLATDVEMPSLYADPSLVRGIDNLTERLQTVLPDLDGAELRRILSDRNRRFAWIRRGLSPRLAQEVHDLGLPSLAFRTELRRAYPLERLGGHVLGAVNVDNRGAAGVERFIDEGLNADPQHGRAFNAGLPVRLTIDLGVQHALEEELKSAISRYEAKGAAGLVMDVRTGEMVASSSLPGLHPSSPAELMDPERRDKIQGGTYELGSIFKIVTVAMGLEGGKTKLDTVFDVTKPLTASRFTIRDVHPAGRPLTTSEILIRSSNVGSGLIALQEGPEKQQAFLDKLGLTTTIRTEVGPVAPPQLPAKLGRVEQITVSYGHGLAVAPIQFAAAVASLINGGTAVTPTFISGHAGSADPLRVVKPETSRDLNVLLRRTVSEPNGTGRRAEVPGYRVGGKTGTAELPGRGGYQKKAVISSFLGAFPMDDPQYLTLILLFEPSGTEETGGEILAGRNAAPTAGRLISRIAPLLGVKPERDVALLRN